MLHHPAARRPPKQHGWRWELARVVEELCDQFIELRVWELALVILAGIASALLLVGLLA